MILSNPFETLKQFLTIIDDSSNLRAASSALIGPAIAYITQTFK